MKKPKVAIVGYGQFGRFMAKHLQPYCTIVPIKRDTQPQKITSCQVVIFAVPWSALETVAQTLAPYISPDAFIIDVLSVKQKPLSLLKKQFAQHQLLGTHPIFGPQSGKHGLGGLPIVLCNVSFSEKNYKNVKRFLKQALQLKVIEQTPKEHDQDMAQVQGLTHLISRAIVQLDIKSHLTNTKSYEQLLELKSLLREDSWELFKTIQLANPQTQKVRADFIKELMHIEEQLTQDVESM